MQRRAYATVVVLLALAGCTADEPTTDASPTDEPPADEPALGAIDRFWADLSGGNDYGDAITQHDRMQEDIAACMSALGFEYTPIVSDVEAVTAVDLDLERGTREYAEEFGYGISTDDMGYYAMLAARADDPNAQYVAGLSPAARAEYDAAMYGGAFADEEFPSWDERGCSGYAENRAYIQVEATETMNPEVLWAEEELMRDAVLLDDRLVALHQAWGECMAEAGHPDLSVPWDGVRRGDGFAAIQAAFEERYMEIQLEQPAGDEDMARAQYGIAALRVKSELAEREISMAVADLDCSVTTGYDEALREVQIERQAEYLELHRTEYEAYAAAYAELRAARDSTG